MYIKWSVYKIAALNGRLLHYCTGRIYHRGWKRGRSSGLGLQMTIWAPPCSCLSLLLDVSSSPLDVKQHSDPPVHQSPSVQQMMSPSPSPSPPPLQCVQCTSDVGVKRPLSLRRRVNQSSAATALKDLWCHRAAAASGPVEVKDRLIGPHGAAEAKGKRLPVEFPHCRSPFGPAWCISSSLIIQAGPIFSHWGGEGDDGQWTHSYFTRGRAGVHVRPASVFFFPL